MRWRASLGAALELATHNYGRAEWWLLLDPLSRGAE